MNDKKIIYLISTFKEIKKELKDKLKKYYLMEKE